MKKIRGLKKAVGTYQRANHALIYFDTETREVWTKEYYDPYSFIEYKNLGIVCITAYDPRRKNPDLPEKITMESLKKYIVENWG